MYIIFPLFILSQSKRLKSHKRIYVLIIPEVDNLKDKTYVRIANFSLQSLIHAIIIVENSNHALIRTLRTQYWENGE